MQIVWRPSPAVDCSDHCNKNKIHSIIHFPLVLSPKFLFQSASRSPCYHTGPGSFGSCFRVFRLETLKLRQTTLEGNPVSWRSDVVWRGENRGRSFDKKLLYLPTDPLVFLPPPLVVRGAGRSVPRQNRHVSPPTKWCTLGGGAQATPKPRSPDVDWHRMQTKGPRPIRVAPPAAFSA